MSLGCQLYRSGLEAPCKALQSCLFINNDTTQGVVQPGSSSPLSLVWQVLIALLCSAKGDCRVPWLCSMLRRV